MLQVLARNPANQAVPDLREKPRRQVTFTLGSTFVPYQEEVLFVFEFSPEAVNPRE